MELPLCQAAFEVLIKAITLLTRNVPTLLQRSRHPDPHLLMSQGFINIPGGHNKAPAWPQDANLKPSLQRENKKVTTACSSLVLPSPSVKGGASFILPINISWASPVC